MRHSAKESGHSLEFNGPLQTREHSFLVIRRKKGLWTDSAVDRDFTPLLYDNMYAPVLYWKGLFMQSGILPRGLYKNKPQLVLRSFFPPAGAVYCLSLVCLVCFVFVSFHSHQDRHFTVWTTRELKSTVYILCGWRSKNSIQSAKTRLRDYCGSDYEFPIAKFRFEMKKVGETTRLSGMT